MKPLAALTAGEAARVAGLVVDLDDTVLDHGQLSMEAYGAVHRAAAGGLPVLVATGRPAGWGEVVARQWPIVGAVTENGAVAFYRDGAGVERISRATAAERSPRRDRLARAAAALFERFPELSAADDNATRLSDMTFDVGERRRLPPEQVAQIAALGRAWGFRVTVSSVHLHLSLDSDDKASGALWFLRQRQRLDATLARSRWAFVGDSGNDASCFAAFDLTFGVANVTRYVPLLSRPPRYVASRERGAGFAEIVSTLLARRENS